MPYCGYCGGIFYKNPCESWHKHINSCRENFIEQRGITPPGSLENHKNRWRNINDMRLVSPEDKFYETQDSIQLQTLQLLQQQQEEMSYIKKIMQLQSILANVKLNHIYLPESPVSKILVDTYFSPDGEFSTIDRIKTWYHSRLGQIPGALEGLRERNPVWIGLCDDLSKIIWLRSNNIQLRDTITQFRTMMANESGDSRFLRN